MFKFAKIKKLDLVIDMYLLIFFYIIVNIFDSDKLINDYYLICSYSIYLSLYFMFNLEVISHQF